MENSPTGPAMIVHGGAGGRALPADRPARRRGLLAAVARGAEILRGGGAALDAVIAAVTVLEDDPYFNAGYGSVLTTDGRVEMDAAVMCADNIKAPRKAAVRAGGVVLVTRVRNPIRLARAVMELTPHLLMAGAGAERIARRAGIPLCRPSELISQRARERWIQTRGAVGKGAAEAPADPAREHGTVGAVARDRFGNLAAATSTGGVPGKLPGRIGDSAIIGAGLYASARGAASATGSGEAIMRAGLCRAAVEAMARREPSRAAEFALQALEGAEAGVILIDAKGRIGFAHNAPAMEIATFTPSAGMRHLAPPSMLAAAE
ncbi:isoaspartyl peptidase/L-asparaginase [bacterium]|nr:isoaspartyl peptidase/L-asparaginase [bacterium]